MFWKRTVKESLEFAENIINTVREPLIALDQDLRVVKVSRSFYEFFKVKPEDTEGQLIYDLGNKQWNIPKLRELLETILPKKATFDNYEVEHDFATIGRRTMLLSARQIERVLGKEKIILLTIEDITERKKAKEMLRREIYFAESLFNTAQTIMLVLDIKGNIVRFNRYLEEILGYKLEEVQGKEWFSTFLPECDRSRIKDVFGAAVSDIKTHGNINPIVTKDGRIRDIEWYDKTLKDEYGNVLGLLAVGQDITERKRAEKALRESEERLRTIVEASLDAIIAVNTEGRLVLFNGAAQELFQYSEEEALNQPADILLREEICKLHQERLEKFLKSGVGRCGHIGRRVERLFRRKDGSLFEAEVSMSGGRLNGLRLVILVIHDITERKRAEETLRRSEENFRHSFDDSPLGVRIVTAEGETIYANRTILDIYGFDSLDELKATPSMKRYTPESYDGFLIRKKKRQQGIDVQSEYTINIIRKDGEVRHLQVFRKGILWDGEIQFQVIYQDITEQNAAEEARKESEERYRSLVLIGAFRSAQLKESEERYRSLVENAHEAIYVVQDGMIKFINRAGVEISGQSKQELTPRPFIEFIHPDDRAMAGERYLKRLKGEVLKSRYIFRVITKNDNIKWLEVSSALINFEGRPATLNIATDITDRKQAEKDLRTSHLQLRTLAKRGQRIREEGMARIAREIHDEMGGGLTGLKMDLSWLLHKMDDAEPSKERVALMDKIHTSNALIDHMIHVVRRISTDLRPSVLDDLGLIAALEWQLSEFTSRTDIPHEFTTTCEYVNMEENTAIAVFRIFQEALTNVMRHSGATKVAVAIREGEGNLFGGESLVLEIRDNGRGITQEEILNPESFGLLGMKERVLAFEGELSICGEPGGGTTLILKIPLKQGEAS